MTMDTNADKQKYSDIMFTNCDVPAELKTLNEDQKTNFSKYLGQKICFEAVYRNSNKQQEIDQPDNYYHAPSFMAYLCCCFYPEQYQSVFGVTTTLFRNKCLAILKFWRDDFLELVEIDEDQPDQQPMGPDLYGPIWLIVTYMIVLGMAANLNDYFSLPNHNVPFSFSTPYLASAVALNLLFRLGQTFLYPAIMGCLDGQLSNTESAHLAGYSIILYIIPTVFCAIPNKTVHTIFLILAAVLRGIFLGRNFASRIRAKGSIGIMYFVVAIIQGMEFILASSVFFAAYAGMYAVASTIPAASNPAHPLHPLVRAPGTTVP